MTNRKSGISHILQVEYKNGSLAEIPFKNRRKARDTQKLLNEADKNSVKREKILDGNFIWHEIPVMEIEETFIKYA